MNEYKFTAEVARQTRVPNAVDFFRDDAPVMTAVGDLTAAIDSAPAKTLPRGKSPSAPTPYRAAPPQRRRHLTSDGGRKPAEAVRAGGSADGGGPRDSTEVFGALPLPKGWEGRELPVSVTPMEYIP